jgi:hypothetical protein
VGKHTAADGASAHPIVAAAALVHRTAGPGGRHPAAGARAAQESGLGWPAPPPPEGGGVGWPRDMTDAVSAAEEPAHPVARRGWRRLLASSRVA